MDFISRYAHLWASFAFLFGFLPVHAQQFCGSDGVHQAHMLHDAAYYKEYKQTELRYQSYIKQNDTYSLKQAKVVGSLYILPVVVHIVHDNGAENIPDAQVVNAINYLNDAFRYIAPFNGPNGADTEIEFCLAKQDPLGNATTGINHVLSATYTEIPYYDSGLDLALKNLSRWDPSKYINIWVIKNIIGSTAGYAYLPPGGVGSNYDGIVLEYGYMGSSKANNNVLVHEMGHYLGLKHTFEGGCPNNNCLVDGDGICDTPPDATKFTCSGNSCATDPDDVSVSNPLRPTALGGLGDQNDMSNNYMDYSSFSCQNAFTLGQKDRMRFFTHPTTGARKLLHTSLGCESPCSSPITASYTFLAPVVSGTSTTFTNTSSGATNYEWYINTILVSTSVNLIYTFTTGGIYTVELVAKNAEISCTQNNKQTINVSCPALGASFSASATTVAVGNVITFTNLTTTALDTTGQNYWYINNVLVSNTKDLTQLFLTKGIYSIKLIVGANSTSCTSEFLIPVTITCPAQADFTATANDVPINTTVGFSNTGINCSVGEWKIDNTSYGTAPTLSHTFTTVGEYVAALICDNGVCKDTAYRVINVYDPFSCGANKRANYWYFGDKAGLNFNSSPPATLFDGAMSTQEGVSSISSKNGSLLFYTNGVKVWDRTHTLMPNGTGLMGATTSAQSALIVPQPGSDTLFYIFTTDSVGENGLRGLRYSKVNMKLNAGLGDVMTTEKNILIEASSNEQVTAVQHGNSCDLWIVAHKSNSTDYMSYLLSSTGLTMTPVLSSGSLNRTYFSYGYLKGSSDGKKLASSFGSAGVELSDFDNFSGVVSNSGMLMTQEQATYGVEFSPNSKLLYVSMTGYSSAIGGAIRKINQYDLTAGSHTAITASAYTIVNESIGQKGSAGALQLANNGKIYVAMPEAALLSTIEAPDIPSSGCLYTSGSVSLAGPGGGNFLSRRGLPAIYPSSLQIADINFSCNGTGISFSYKGNISNPDTYFWDFGDPTSGSANYSNDANPVHTFTGTGTFIVKLIVKKQCLCATVSKSITLPLGCTLPSGVLTFQGKRTNTSISLKWVNENEKDLLHYEVERKFESVNEFETIKVEGSKQNCTSVCDHQIQDQIPAHLSLETVFYRLKLTDKDGKVEYSNIVKLGPYESGLSSVRIYPNPLGTGQPLTFESSGELIQSIQLSDLSGKIILEHSGVNEKQFTEKLFLTAGMYLIRIGTEERIIYQRLLVGE